MDGFWKALENPYLRLTLSIALPLVMLYIMNNLPDGNDGNDGNDNMFEDAKTEGAIWFFVLNFIGFIIFPMGLLINIFWGFLPMGIAISEAYGGKLIYEEEQKIKIEELTQQFRERSKAEEYECTDCGGTVDKNDAICKWCGEEFTQEEA